MINCFRAVLGCKLLQGNGASIVTVVVSKTDRQAGREGGEGKSLSKNPWSFLARGG